MEQIHQKELFDIEHADHKLTDNDCKKSIRQANQLMVSLGEELWQASQGWRCLEEKAGKLPVLGADYEGAFSAVLLKLYQDPTKSSKRSPTVQSTFRSDAIATYGSDKGVPKDCLFCPITNIAHEKTHIRAAHIVPSHLGPEIMEYLFGPGYGLRLYSADNCLMMFDLLEKQFDKGHFVLLPVDPAESPITRWKVQITNDDAKDSFIINEQFLKDFQVRELVFKNAARPAARFLYYHFVVMLLRNAHYKVGNHEHYSKELPTGKPFPTMGRYLRRSMIHALAREAGDVDKTAQALIENGGETTFDAGQNKLTDAEEEEIARRLLAAGDAGEEDEDDESEEDY